MVGRERPALPAPEPQTQDPPNGELASYLTSADKIRAALDSKRQSLKQLARVQSKYNQAIAQIRQEIEIHKQTCHDFDERVRLGIQEDRRDLEKLGTSDLRQQITKARRALTEVEDQYEIQSLENTEIGIGPDLTAQKRSNTLILAIYESLGIPPDTNCSVDERWRAIELLSE